MRDEILRKIKLNNNSIIEIKDKLKNKVLPYPKNIL